MHLSLDQPHSPPQTTSGSNQPFCHNTLCGPRDRRTDQQIDRWSRWMWCNMSSLLAMLIYSDVLIIIISLVPSVLWRCWLGDRKGIQPVENWMVGCLHDYLSGARWRFAYGPADPTVTHCLLLQKIHIGFGFTFLLLAHPSSPRQNPDSCKMVVVYHFTASYWNKKMSNFQQHSIISKIRNT